VNKDLGLLATKVSKAATGQDSYAQRKQGKAVAPPKCALMGLKKALKLVRDPAEMKTTKMQTATAIQP